MAEEVEDRRFECAGLRTRLRLPPSGPVTCREDVNRALARKPRVDARLKPTAGRASLPRSGHERFRHARK
jgi:hypothetical protein